MLKKKRKYLYPVDSELLAVDSNNACSVFNLSSVDRVDNRLGSGFIFDSRLVDEAESTPFSSSDVAAEFTREILM